MLRQQNIRFIFSLIGLGAVVLVGLGVWTFAQSYLRVTVVTETQRIAGAVTTNGFRLAMVTNELFLHGEIRSEQQWRAYKEKLHGLLTENHEILAPYRLQTANIENSLDNLEKLYISARSTIAAIRQPQHELHDEEAYNIQVTQMLIRVAELQSSVDELESVVRFSVERTLGSSEDGILFKLVGLFSLILLFGVLVWWLFFARLQIPLTALAQGIKTISKGDADFRPRKYAEDELGAVVDALNALLDQNQEAERQRLENEARILKLATDLGIKNRQFAIISRFQAQFIHEPNHFVMFDSLLKEVINLSESEFGFIGDILQDDDNNDYLKCYAFSNIAWNDETRQFYEENKSTGFIFKKLDNLFWHVITDRTAIISNDPANDPRSAGIPPGHPPLKAFLGIPVWYGERLVGEIGLANRKKGYNQEVLNQLQPIIEACGRIIVARWEREAQKKTEKELMRARKYLQSIFDLMPSGLIVVKPDGSVKQWNKAAEFMNNSITALSRNLSMDDILSLADEQREQLKLAVREQQPLAFKQIVQLINNEQRYWDIVSFPLDEESGDVVIRLDDVSDRVRMQLMMVQSEKMISVGGLAAGMAHELNSPLGGMLQGLQNIRRRLSPELKKNIDVAQELGINLAQLQVYLQQRNINNLIEGINDAGKRASDIIYSMTLFSRTQDDVFTPVDLGQLLDDVVTLAALDYDMKKRYAFRDIEIVKDFDADLPAVQCLDKEIKQVILNLLRNAAQSFCEQQDHSEPPQISLQTRQEGKYALIIVSDNGQGMDKLTLKRIFEPFFTTRMVGEGAGLGLSVSYFIIHDQHHGKISVQSEPGMGTIVTIRLPLKPE